MLPAPGLVGEAPTPSERFGVAGDEREEPLADWQQSGVGAAASQPHAQEHAGGPLEEEIRKVHVLAVEAVEQRQLLMPVAGIVGRVDVEDEASGLLAGHALKEHLHQQAVDLGDLPGGDGVLEPTEGGLSVAGGLVVLAMILLVRKLSRQDVFRRHA